VLDLQKVGFRGFLGCIRQNRFAQTQVPIEFGPLMSTLLNRLNPQLARLPVYVPGRPIDDVARELGLDPSTVCKLASNENPLGPSPKAIEAIHANAGQVHLYPDGSAFHLKRKLAALLDVAPDCLILGNGSNELLEWVAHAVLAPGDEVVVSQFCFAVYPIVTALAGATLVTVPAISGKLAADIPAMVKAITPRTKALFLANPNNPTGTLTSRADITLLLTETPENVLIVMDEAYIEFLEDPVDCLELIRQETYPNLLLTRTFSKVFGLAGLRLGYGIGPKPLIAAFERIRQPFNVNALAQAAAMAALDDSVHLANTRANNQMGLTFFQETFTRLRWEFIPSHANFILLNVGDGAQVFRALQSRGIITRPMASYDLPAWLRISIGTPQQNHRCLQALTEILGSSSGDVNG
jgi:histidinol-phosphate aminotransferase